MQALAVLIKALHSLKTAGCGSGCQAAIDELLSACGVWCVASVMCSCLSFASAGPFARGGLLAMQYELGKTAMCSEANIPLLTASGSTVWISRLVCPT